MRAIMMRETGAPSVLKCEEVPIPEVGPTEALIRVRAVGVPYHDVVERNGIHHMGVKLPMIIGYEIAGTVEKLGDRVTTLKPGDRVCNKPISSCGLCRLCRNGMETGCPNRKFIRGGYADYVAIPEEALVTIPDTVGFREACMLGASTGVALNAVRDVAKVTLGETVLVTGASGGLGLPSMELVKASGARTIALSRSPEKAQALRDSGADEVVIADTGTQFHEQVMALTDGIGVNVVIDNIGSVVFKSSFRSLAIGGRYTMVGQLLRENISINPAFIFFRRAQILGVGSVRRDQLQDAVRLVALGQLKPRVADIFPLEQAAEAHTLVEAGGVVGRVILEP